MKQLSTFLWTKLSSWMSAHRLVSPAHSPIFSTPGRKFLHVGCGWAKKHNAGKGFQDEDWKEIRLDIDPVMQPDILANMLDMNAVPAESVDAVYSSHNIEHLYPHEVPRALAEFNRVLKPDGLLVVACPDLQSVCGLIAEGKLTEPAYVSSAGPVAPLDILYGFRPELADGNLFMAHRTGFSQHSLLEELRAAGFMSVVIRRRKTALELCAVATKESLQEDALIRLAELHLPPE